jgi:hypothetical protein
MWRRRRLSVAKTLTCQCGQTLDIEDFQPGDQIQCPSCDTVLTIPAAEPVVAMAAPVEDDDDIRASAHATAEQYISPLKRRQQAERRSRYASQARLKRVMIWPCLVLGLASLGVAGLGVMWAVAEQAIEIVNEDGMDVVYANIEIEKGSGKFERINVKPNIVPADKIGRPTNVPVEYKVRGDDSLYYTYNGVRPERKGGVYQLLTSDGLAKLKELGPLYEQVDKHSGQLIKDFAKEAKDNWLRVKQSGFWFYQIGDDGKPLKKMNDLSLMAELRSGQYVLVKYHGPDDFRTPKGRKVQLAYYKAEDEYLSTKLGEFKLSGPPMGLEPAFFIWSGLAIGLVLAAAGAFFIYESYFSKTAKAAQEKRKAEEATEQAVA